MQREALAIKAEYVCLGSLLRSRGPRCLDIHLRFCIFSVRAVPPRLLPTISREMAARDGWDELAASIEGVTRATRKRRP